MDVDNETKALIKLKVSKSKHYEAKVGIIELQKRWDQRSLGMSI
jgi:hypothetical protein